MTARVPIEQESLSDITPLRADERRRRLRQIQLPVERKIIKHPDFEIAWPERVSVVGFGIITLICVIIVLGTWLLGKWLAAL